MDFTLWQNKFTLTNINFTHFKNYFLPPAHWHASVMFCCLPTLCNYQLMTKSKHNMNFTISMWIFHQWLYNGQLQTPLTNCFVSLALQYLILWQALRPPSQMCLRCNYQNSPNLIWTPLSSGLQSNTERAEVSQSFCFSLRFWIIQASLYNWEISFCNQINCKLE